MLNKKQFTKYLISKSNSDLLKTVKNSSFYNKSDIVKVKAEIARRKKFGLMRKTAGIRKSCKRK